MNREINIHQDDILWRFYCKRFLVEDKEVKPPKNLCQYFWTSVGGFGLWLGREVKLRNLWLIGLITTAMLFAMARAIPDASNVITTVLVITIAAFWNFALLTAMFVTLYRIKRAVEVRIPWATYLLGFCIIALVIIHMAVRGMLWPEFTRLFSDLLQLMGYMLIVMIAMLIIMPILSTIPHHRLQELRRIFQTLGAFVSAKKSRVCPPVNPPEGFKIKS